MNTSQTVSKSQFKAKALEYLRKVEKEKKPLIITHGGKPVAQVSPYRDKESDEEILKRLRGSVSYYGDIIEPIDEEWEALK